MRAVDSNGSRRRSGAAMLEPHLWLGICLLLLPVFSMADEKTAADYFVESLPGQPEGPLLTMHAG